MAVVSTTSPSDVLVESLRRQFIPFLREDLHLEDFGVDGTLERHGGSKQLRWLQFNKITTDSTSSLAEGSASAGEVTALSVTTYSSTVAEYGAWIPIGSLADVAATRETRQQYVEGFSEHGARTIDTLDRNALVGGESTNFLVSSETAANTGTLATTDTANAQDLAVITGFFRGKDAKPPRNGSGNFVVIVHSEVEQDLVTEISTTRLSWSEVNKHVPGIDGQKKIIDGSPGAIYGTMVLVSNNIGTATLTNNTVAYANIALARFGLGRTGFRGMTPRNGAPGTIGPQIIQKPASIEGGALNMFSTLGWKAARAQIRLDDNQVLIYYSAK